MGQAIPYVVGAALGAGVSKMSGGGGGGGGQRDMNEEYYQNIRTQLDLEQGTGRFSDIGPLVEREAAARPKWLDLEAASLRQATEGLGATWEEVTQPMLSRIEATAARYQREADLADVERLGGRAFEATMGADPLMREASELSLRTAMEGVNSPVSTRNFEQYVKDEQGLRGMAYSPYAAAEAAYQKGLMEEQMGMARQGQLGQAIGQRSAFVNPWQQVLGRQGQTFSAMGGTSGQASGMASSLGPKIYQPESQYGADVYASNQQAAMAAAQSRSMQRTGLYSGLMGLGGSTMLAGGHAGGFGNLFGGGGGGGGGGNPLFRVN